MGSIKVNKKAAEKLIKEGYTIKLLPCNIRLSNLWFDPARCNTEMLSDYGTTFEKFANEYHYYNCGNETGRRISYYWDIDFTMSGYTEKTLGYKDAKRIFFDLLKEREEKLAKYAI